MHPFFVAEFWSRLRIARRCIIGGFLLGAISLSLLELAAAYVGVDGRSAIYDGQMTGGHPVALNQDGTRGPQPTGEKPPDTKRLLCLGDSTTFGTGVSGSATWPARIANSSKFETINAGVPAASIKDLCHETKTTWSKLDVDGILLAMSNNMLSLAFLGQSETARVPQGRARQLEASRAKLSMVASCKRGVLGALSSPTMLKRSAIRLLYFAGVTRHRIDPSSPFGPLLAHGWQQADLPKSISDRAWRALAASLLEMKNTAESLGVPMVATWFPARFMLSNDQRDNEKFVPRWRITQDPVERSKSICSQLGIPFVDIREALRETRKKPRSPGDKNLYIPMDYTHFNDAGHRAIANALKRPFQ